MTKKIPNGLTPEDRALWEKVTETIKPPPKKALKALFFQVAEGEFRSAMRLQTEWTPEAPNQFSRQENNQATTTPAALLTKQANRKIRPPLPAMAPLDRKSKSRLARGLTLLDATLDLHGMTQEKAYLALRYFLERAHASNWKTILVITGKGARKSDENPQSYFDDTRQAPGILRRKVPQWLQEPDLRPFVIGYDTASVVHGGTGALYVRIRRR